MRPGRVLFVVMVMAWGMNAVPAYAETFQVTIDNLDFRQAETHAKIGDTIVWVNRDDFDHTATVNGGWDVTIPANTSISLLMKKSGSVEYYCRFHPNMRGAIDIVPK